jgi:hypothetical protein
LYMLWVMLPIAGLYNCEGVHVQVGRIHEPDSANLDIMSMKANKETMIRALYMSHSWNCLSFRFNGRQQIANKKSALDLVDLELGTFSTQVQHFTLRPPNPRFNLYQPCTTVLMVQLALCLITVTKKYHCIWSQPIAAINTAILSSDLSRLLLYFLLWIIYDHQC